MQRYNGIIICKVFVLIISLFNAYTVVSLQNEIYHILLLRCLLRMVLWL